MIKLNKQEYDLNNLLGLNFDMLKEVLMKLSKNQNEIESELNDIRETNEKRDKKISDLEKKIRDLSNINNKYNIKINEMMKKMPEKNKLEDYIKNENKNQNDDINNDNKNDNKNDDNNNNNNYDNDENYNKKENKEDNEDKNNLNNKNYIKENGNKDIIKKERIGNNSEPKEHFVSSKENDFNTESSFDNEDNKERNKNRNKKNSMNYSFYRDKVRKKEKEKEKDEEVKKKDRPVFKTSNQIIDLNSAILQKSQVSYDTIRTILHSITEINDKLNFLEDALHKKFKESVESSKKLLSDHNLQSKSKFDSINNKIEKLFSKNYETNRNLDELSSKYDELAQKIDILESKKPEIINIIDEKNDEDKKLMSSTFKESILKNFEMNEDKLMKEAGENFKLRQNMNRIQGYIDRLNKLINALKNDNKNLKEDMESLRKNMNEVIDNKNNELKNDIKEEIDKNASEVNNDIDKKIRELLDYLLEGNINIKDNSGNNNDNKPNGDESNKIDKALTKLLNKKVNELSDKIIQIEQDLKNERKNNIQKNKELEEVKQCVVELYDNINKKIGKEDLKELNDYYLNHINEIKIIKLKIQELTDLQEKMKAENPNFIKRLESLTHDVFEMKETGYKKVVTTGKQIDYSNYINEKKLKNALTPIVEEIQKLISDNQYMNLTIKDISEQITLLEKKEHVDLIESELNEKINLLSKKIAKKYLERVEFIKVIKNIEIQLKLLQGNNQTKEGDSWLLANQPLKCFNCATCEANVTNSVQPREYLPWNRYPYETNQYRIGQGFSKLLQKIYKNIDDNKNSIDNENSNKYLGNSMNNINEIIKIKNRVQNKDEKFAPTNMKKYRLPKVIESFRRKQKSIGEIPLSDDEKENGEVLIKKEIITNSPRILKINKLKNENEIQNLLEINNFSRNKSSNSPGKKNNQINRVKSVPIY